MKLSIPDRVKDAYKTPVIMDLFYKHRLERVQEMILGWENSDAWETVDRDKCIKHLEAIKSVIEKRIKN